MAAVSWMHFTAVALLLAVSAWHLTMAYPTYNYNNGYNNQPNNPYQQQQPFPNPSKSVNNLYQQSDGTALEETREGGYYWCYGTDDGPGTIDLFIKCRYTGEPLVSWQSRDSISTV